MNEQAPPVKEGETYDVFIKSIGEKGDGIARVNGFVLFVPNVAKGDYVKVRIKKVLQKVGFAEVVEKLEKPERPQKYETITEDEASSREQEPEQHYEDTEDFGGDLEEE